MIAVGCGSSPSTALRIDLTRGVFGSRSYTLRCSPTGGTVSNAAALCTAIKTDTSLTLSHPGGDHSCPYGPPLVRVTGRRSGRRVDAQFSVCRFGQERSAARWIESVGYGPLWVTAASTSAARCRRRGSPQCSSRDHAHLPVGNRHRCSYVASGDPTRGDLQSPRLLRVSRHRPDPLESGRIPALNRDPPMSRRLQPAVRPGQTMPTGLHGERASRRATRCAREPRRSLRRPIEQHGLADYEVPGVQLERRLRWLA